MLKIKNKKIIKIVLRTIAIILALAILISAATVLFYVFQPIGNYNLEVTKTKYQDYTNSYKISLTDTTKEAIENAYNEAVNLTAEETAGFDSILIDFNGSGTSISEPLVFNEKCKSELPIIFSSQNGKAVISGGLEISGNWKDEGNGIFSRKIDNAENFRQLYVNKKQAVRSRFPEKSDDYQSEVLTGKWLDDSKELALPKDFEKYISKDNLSDIEIHIVEAWTHSIAKVKSYRTDSENIIFALTPDSEEKFFSKRSSKIAEPKIWIEKSLSTLDSQGEWYYDNSSKMLYYYPENPEEINNLMFTIPQAEQLVKINNCENIRFNNINFAYTNWNEPSYTGFLDGQATSYMKITDDVTTWQTPIAGIEISNSDGIEFMNCSIENIGSAAIKFDEYCDNMLLYYNDIKNIAAGAIVAGSFSDSGEKKLYVPKNITITDNVIDGIGKSYLGGVGIMVGYAQNLIVDHNEVNDGSYTGISVGWGWGAVTDMQNYQIRNNKVTNIIENHLYDGAGLYVLGTFQTTEKNRISGNYLEGGHGYAGLYFDEKSNYFLAENNVIGKGNMGFLLMHDLNYGLEDITVQNNFVDTRKKFINSYKLDKSVKWSSHSKRKLVVKNNYTILNSKWQENREMIIENAGRRSK